MSLANTIVRPAAFLTPSRAIEVASAWNEADPDWTYTPTNPDGSLGPFSKVAIADEDGEFVGYVCPEMAGTAAYSA